MAATTARPVRRPGGVLQAVVLLAIAWIFLYPIARLVWLSFESDTFPTGANYREVLTEEATWRAVRNTVVVAVSGTAISLTLGTSLAWLAAYTDIRAKGLLHALVVLPFVLPAYVYTIAWVQFTVPASWPTRVVGLLPGIGARDATLFGLPGISFILGIRHMPLVYLLTLGVLRRIPRQLEQAARASGAGPVVTFRRVTLPLALPGIAGGGTLAFLSCLDNFGVPAILGIPARVSVLSTAIYQEVVSFGPVAFARAAVLAVLLGAVAIAGSAGPQLALRRARSSETVAEDRSARVSHGRARPLVEAVLLTVLVVVSVLPLVAMVRMSLTPAPGVPLTWDTATLENYRFAVFENEGTRRALRNSAQFAASAAAIGVVLATFVAYHRTRRGGWAPRAMDAAISLPYAMPGLVIALAMILAWLDPIPGSGWNPGLYGTAGIILIAYVVRFTYYQLRAMLTGFVQVDATMEEAARASGVGRLHTWRVVLLPLLVPAIVSGTALVVFVALTELTVSSILWSSGSETVGVRVYGFQAAGYSRYATALSTTIVVGLLAAMALSAAFTRLWRRRTHVAAAEAGDR